MNDFVMTGMIATPLAILTLAGGFQTRARHRRFRSRLVTTTGRIVAAAETGDDGTTMYQPVIEYVTSNGVPVRFKDNGCSSHPTWKVGDIAPVLYDPEAPERAQSTESYDPSKHLLLMGTIFTLFGMLFLVLGLTVIPE
jgi:hypothetical protein